MKPGKFTGVCRNDWLDPKWDKFVQTDPPFSYTSARFPHITIMPEDGFVHDGGSVPRILHWFIDRREFLPAFVPHDKGYKEGKYPKWVYDYILREAMYTLAQGHAPFKRLVVCVVMYLCGWFAWWGHRKGDAHKCV